MTQCAKIIVGFMPNVGHVYIKSLQTFFPTFFNVFLFFFYLNVYYIYETKHIAWKIQFTICLGANKYNMGTLKLSTNDLRSVKNSSIVYFFGSNAKYLAVLWNMVVIFLYMLSSTSSWSLAVFKNWCSGVRESIHGYRPNYHGLCCSRKLSYKRCALSTGRPKFRPPPTAPAFSNRSFWNSQQRNISGIRPIMQHLVDLERRKGGLQREQIFAYFSFFPFF